MPNRQNHDTPRRDDHPGDGVARGTARMEAFADAVLAIAFTLPVVEIALPERGGAPLGEELAELWQSYLGFALSSGVIGLYWLQHHFSGAIYRTTGHYFNLATILFLATITFIAFPARTFAEQVTDPAAREVAAQFFTFALAASALAWFAKWTVGRASGHIDDRLDPAYVARLDRTYRRSAIVMAVAAGLSLLSWPAGLAVAALHTLLYLRPPETPVFIEEAPVVEGED